MTDLRRAYAFFERRLVVVTDSRAVADALDAVYARQRIRLPRHEPDLTVRIASAPDPCIEVGGRTVRVPAVDQLAHYAHLVLINAAASLVTDALVLHAGAVTKYGAAVVLLGHSGRGKTTLTIELVRRGFGFLSDDFAVIGSDGLVRPFPRRVNLTDNSLGLLGLTLPAGTLRLPGPGGQTKSMVDIGDLFPGSLSGPTPLGGFVFLGPAPTPMTESALAEAVEWRLEVDHNPPGFEAALAELPGVADLAAKDTTIDLTTQPGSRIVGSLDDLCARFDVTIMSHARRSTGAPGGGDSPAPAPFAGPPEVTTVATSRLTTEILAYSLSLSGARFLGRSGPAEMLRALANLQGALAGRTVGAVRLTPGELGATADVVERMVSRVGTADISPDDKQDD
jgi:hypothetical protein